MSAPDWGDKEFEGVGFPTPSSIPDETACRTFQIPASGDWQAVVMGAVELLSNPANWQQFEGGIERDEAAERVRQMVSEAYALAETGSCDAEVQCPYWDDATDVGDDMSAEDQTWYGEITNPADPPAELDFVENLAVWAFTGLVALATPELGFAPAILFHTVAQKFLIAQKAGDLAAITHIVLDGGEVARVDTTGRTGEIIETPVIGDPTLDAHDLLIWSEVA